MKRASYREAVRWVAENDSDGDAERLEPHKAAELVSAHLVADIFDVDVERVGRDIVRVREKNDRAAAKRAAG